MQTESSKERRWKGERGVKREDEMERERGGRERSKERR